MSYYWELLALPKNQAYGNYGCSQQQLDQQLDQYGVHGGQAIYDSLITTAV